MKYVIDHDCHIHSKLSSCSNHPEETTERILAYALENHFKTVTLTDHYWDETVEGASGWYAVQNTAHIKEALPLPRADGVRFLFGCETELNKKLTVGVSRARMEELDFIIIPTTHLHMEGYTIERNTNASRRTELWCERFEAILSMDLPFHKIGIAHLACTLLSPARDVEQHKFILRTLPEERMRRIFTDAAKKGLGIELNIELANKDEEHVDLMFRPFRIAAECGCRFYLGSDAHTPDRFDEAPADFRTMVETLGLTEEQKFPLFA